MSLYQSCIRPVLFRFDAERVHETTLRACETLGTSRFIRQQIDRAFAVPDARLATEMAGLRLRSPIGLAAGFDKNGRAAGLLPSLGFGFIEVGSISADPSVGNPVRPRLWRVPADDGLMVYYGVPNDGAMVVARRLTAQPRSVPLGVSLVETNRGTPTPLDAVIEEIVRAAQPFLGIADYFALNLHCPNSGGGYSHFDDPRHLALLLERFCAQPRLPPVLIKITPPADPAITDKILRAVDPYLAVKGFILNTHAPRPYTYVRTPQAELSAMRGSMTSGWLREPVNLAIADWYARIDRTRHILVGVGGIGSAADAYTSIRLGASVVELLTALVFRGPGLIAEINRGLATLLARDGFACVADAVGVDNRQRAAA